MNTVVCQQPNYFPWLGYLQQCARADTFICLDTVQFLKQGRHNRSRVLPHPGASAPAGYQWLTVPVSSRQHHSRPLGAIEIDRTQDWSKRHWKTLESVYGRSPYFKSQLEPWIRPWLEGARSFKTLLEASLGSVSLSCDLLGLRPRILLSSTLTERGTSTERLVSLCQAVQATTYYSGIGSTYIDSQLFRDAGLELLWQRWKHPEYPQANHRGFRSHLSILDALAFVPLGTIRDWLTISPFLPTPPPPMDSHR